MARLSSTLARSKVYRVTDHVKRVPAQLSYSWAGRPYMTINLRADDEDDPKARNYRVDLDSDDILSVVDRMFNPSYSIGAFLEHKFNDQASNAFEELLAKRGIVFKTYAYPRLNRDGYAYVRGISKEHALYQFEQLRKLIVGVDGKLDPRKIEEWVEL